MSCTSCTCTVYSATAYTVLVPGLLQKAPFEWFNPKFDDYISVHGSAELDEMLRIILHAVQQLMVLGFEIERSKSECQTEF